MNKFEQASSDGHLMLLVRGEGSLYSEVPCPEVGGGSLHSEAPRLGGWVGRGCWTECP